MNGLCLRLYTKVEISSIMPTSLIKTGNMFSCFEFSLKCRRALKISIEVIVIQRRHARIVEVDEMRPAAGVSGGRRPQHVAAMAVAGQPLAVAAPAAMADALNCALEIAAGRGAAQVSCFIPGDNEAALSTAVARGFRIVFPAMLMSSKPFGDWSRYLPRNPGFM